METSEGYILKMDAQKIYEIPNGWFAGAGSLQDVQKVKEWLENGAQEETKPTVTDFNAIVIWDGIPSRVSDDLVFQSCSQAAEGEGWIVASAALKLGKSAKRAVELASEMCLGVGGKIQVVRVIE